MKDNDSSLYLSPSSKNMANVRSNNVESIPTRRVMPDRKAKNAKSQATEMPQSPSMSILMRRSSIPTPVRNSSVKRVATGIQSASTVQSPLALIKHALTKQTAKAKQQLSGVASELKSKSVKALSSEQIIPTIPVSKSRTVKKLKTDDQKSSETQSANTSNIFNSSIPVPKSIVKSSAVSKKPEEIPEIVPHPQPVKKTRSKNNKLVESQSADLLNTKSSEAGAVKKTRTAKKIIEPPVEVDHKKTVRRVGDKKGKSSAKLENQTEVQSSSATVIRSSSRNKEKTENPPKTLELASEIPSTVTTRRRVAKSSPKKTAAEKRTKTLKSKKTEKMNNGNISPKPDKIDSPQQSTSSSIAQKVVDVEPRDIAGSSHKLHLKTKKKHELVIEVDLSKPQIVPEQFDSAPVRQEHLNFFDAALQKPKVIHTPVQKFMNRDTVDFKTPNRRSTLDFDDDTFQGTEERRHSKVWHSPIMNTTNPMDDSNLENGLQEKEQEAEPTKCPASPPIASNYAKILAANAEAYKNANKPLPAASYKVLSSNENVFAASTSQFHNQHQRVMSMSRRRLESSLNDSNAENKEPDNYKKSGFNTKKNFVKNRVPLDSIPVLSPDESGEDVLNSVEKSGQFEGKRVIGNAREIHTSTPIAAKRKQLLLTAHQAVSS